MEAQKGSAEEGGPRRMEDRILVRRGEGEITWGHALYLQSKFRDAVAGRGESLSPPLLDNARQAALRLVEFIEARLASDSSPLFPQFPGALEYLKGFVTYQEWRETRNPGCRTEEEDKELMRIQPCLRGLAADETVPQVAVLQETGPHGVVRQVGKKEERAEAGSTVGGWLNTIRRFLSRALGRR